MTTAEVESDDAEYNSALSIAEWHISEAFELQAHQSHAFPFSIQLPFETPVTDGALPYQSNPSVVTYTFRCGLGARCH